MKRIIKMNDNNFLSLGNFCNILKDKATNKSNVSQLEIFCALFDCNDINITTVNNYCVGLRPIGIEYKKTFYELKEKFKDDKNVYIDIIKNILSLVDNKIYSSSNFSVENIEKSETLIKILKQLFILINNDDSIDEDTINKLKDLYDNSHYYECFINILNYIVLDNKQPRYKDSDNVINENDLKEYLNLSLTEGNGYITSLQTLAKKGNVYANSELGSLEFSGFVSGKPNFQNSFDYYMVAAKKNHPKACWMIANLIYTKRIKNLDINLAWEYLNKAISLNSIAAVNTLGNCFLNGNNPENIIDEKKAFECFTKAAKENYKYAYNNLGLYYERHNNLKKAIYYFNLSASQNESWALNKLGEINRLNGNLKDAFFYYKKSSETPIADCNFYSYYNLARYYYLNGCKELNINKDTKKAIEYLTIAKEHNIKSAAELLKELGE